MTIFKHKNLLLNQYGVKVFFFVLNYSTFIILNIKMKNKQSLIANDEAVKAK